MKKPELQDFRITPEEYTHYQQLGQTSFDKVSDRLGVPIVLFTGMIVGITVFIYTSDWGKALASVFIGLIFPGPFIAVGLLFVVFPVIKRIQKLRISQSPLRVQIKQYEEAIAVYSKVQEEAERARRDAERARQAAEQDRQAIERVRRRKLREHWMSLSGAQFERELGTLYRYLGYQVKSTPTSGDQGIDLILRRGGKTTVVQCKSHKSPVGPAVVRELYGALVASKANDAILACTGGFTRGVRDFVRDKPITLISATELARMGEGVGQPQPEQIMLHEATVEGLICPVRGCGSKMALRTGKLGKFWGCRRYPKCKGTRNSV